MLSDYFACTWPQGLDPLTDEVAYHIDGFNDEAHQDMPTAGWESQWEAAATSTQTLVKPPASTPRRRSGEKRTSGGKPWSASRIFCLA